MQSKAAFYCIPDPVLRDMEVFICLWFPSTTNAWGDTCSKVPLFSISQAAFYTSPQPGWDRELINPVVEHSICWIKPKIWIRKDMKRNAKISIMHAKVCSGGKLCKVVQCTFSQHHSKDVHPFKRLLQLLIYCYVKCSDKKIWNFHNMRRRELLSSKKGMMLDM